jgi:hypothetical protein
MKYTSDSPINRDAQDALDSIQAISRAKALKRLDTVTAILSQTLIA